MIGLKYYDIQTNMTTVTTTTTAATASTVTCDAHMTKVLDMFIEKINKKFKIDLSAEEKFDSFVTRFKNMHCVENKPKRAPSAYNLYVKKRMAELREEDPTLTGKELMKKASAGWKKDKESQ